MSRTQLECRSDEAMLSMSGLVLLACWAGWDVALCKGECDSRINADDGGGTAMKGVPALSGGEIGEKESPIPDECSNWSMFSWSCGGLAGNGGSAALAVVVVVLFRRPGEGGLEASETVFIIGVWRGIEIEIYVPYLPTTSPKSSTSVIDLARALNEEDEVEKSEGDVDESGTLDGA
jgi:hypothetical protein